MGFMGNLYGKIGKFGEFNRKIWIFVLEFFIFY